jgi:hypothetical protein
MFPKIFTSAVENTHSNIYDNSGVCIIYDCSNKFYQRFIVLCHLLKARRAANLVDTRVYPKVSGLAALRTANGLALYH